MDQNEEEEEIVIKESKGQFHKVKFERKQTDAKLGFVKSELPDDLLELEPEGDLSFTSDKSNFELLIDHFDTTDDLNWCWQKKNEDDQKEFYDDIASMCLEMNFRCYQVMEEEKEKDKYRFVQF